MKEGRRFRLPWRRRSLLWRPQAGIAAWLCLAAFASSPARADDGEAEALLRLGVSLRREHRDEEALTLFARALAMEPTPTAHAQVALAYQALGRWPAAVRELALSLAETDDPWVKKNRNALEKARADIEGHLAWLTVVVDPVTAEVQVDGVALRLATEAPVTAGESILEVRARGYAPGVRRLHLAPGVHLRVEILLSPVATRAPPPPVVVPLLSSGAERPASHASAPPLGPLVFGVVGLAGIGAGIYFGVRVLDNKDARDAQCARRDCSVGAIYDDADARSSATLATVAWGAGLAYLSAGTAWWILRKRLWTRPGLRHVGPGLLGALGLVEVGVGTFSGLHAIAERKSRDDLCTAGGCAPAAVTHDRDARTSATVSTLAWAVGLSSLAAGTVWWCLGGERKNSTAAPWRARPLVGSQTYGVVMEGQFE